MGFRRGSLEPTFKNYVEARKREQRRLERLTRALRLAAGPRPYDWERDS